MLQRRRQKIEIESAYKCFFETFTPLQKDIKHHRQKKQANALI